MRRCALAATASTAARISSSELITRIWFCSLVLPDDTDRVPPGAETRCEKLLKSSSPVVIERKPICDLCPHKPRGRFRNSVPNASRFHREIALSAEKTCAASHFGRHIY